MQREAARKRFTADEYYRMAEIGILVDSMPTELLDGEVVEMSPMGAGHRAAVSRCISLFVPLFKGKAEVSAQLPVRLDDFSEPEPDLALIVPRKDFYKKRHPGPLDVWGILETSDSSLHYDRDVKLPIYAAARIKEFWILDLKDEVLHVFRDPQRGAYATALTFRRGDAVSFLAFPDIEIPVSDLLGADSE